MEMELENAQSKKKKSSVTICKWLVILYLLLLPHSTGSVCVVFKSRYVRWTLYVHFFILVEFKPLLLYLSQGKIGMIATGKEI